MPLASTNSTDNQDHTAHEVGAFLIAMLRERNKRSIAIVSNVSVVSMLIGAGIGLSRGGSAGAVGSIAEGALTGLIIAVGCSCAELFFLSNSNLRLSRWVAPIWMLVIRAIICSGFILIGLSVPSVLFGGLLPWDSPDFWEVFAVSAVVALCISTGVELVRLLGREATLSLLTTRYHSPRLEKRVVLFADLVGSTALAERLGDLQFHQFLSEVAQDLGEPIVKAGGDVHRYVGDAVIVTWPFERGVRNAACLRCAQQMHAALEERSVSYENRFGTAPKMRVAVHGGLVAAGEIGDWKKEIALLGDTMNTAARIEGAARNYGARSVFSEEVARSFAPDIRAQLNRLPSFTAAGKQEDLVLWTDTEQASLSTDGKKAARSGAAL